MSNTMVRRWGGPAALCLALVAGCDNSGVDLGFGALKANTVRATVYLDRDGSRAASSADTVYGGARVALIQRGTTDTVKTAISDLRGVALFTNVSLGEYSVAVASNSLGDSVLVAAVDTSIVQSSNLPTASIKVRVQDDTTDLIVRLSYPEVSLRQARNLAPGKRVFIRGTILAGVQSFRDTTSHIQDTSAAIRLTDVSLRNLSSNPPGDSVSVLGLTSSRAGQPILAQAVISRLQLRPPPVASIVVTAAAASASNGSLDARLVLVQGALISDTATVAPDYTLTVSDGSGALTILMDANINFNRAAFIPGRRVTCRGVLVPNGNGGWSLKPREVNDLF
jgi:hypothetical protein